MGRCEDDEGRENEMTTKTIAERFPCSCGIGDDLRVYGSERAIMRVQELFGRRCRELDAGLPKNRRVEGARDGLGMETMSVGTGKDGEPLDVTGNTDAMTRIQAIYLADSRRRAASRMADIGHLDIAARLRARSINPNWAQNLISTAPIG